MRVFEVRIPPLPNQSEGMILLVRARDSIDALHAALLETQDPFDTGMMICDYEEDDRVLVTEPHSDRQIEIKPHRPGQGGPLQEVPKPAPAQTLKKAPVSAPRAPGRQPAPKPGRRFEKSKEMSKTVPDSTDPQAHVKTQPQGIASPLHPPKPTHTLERRDLGLFAGPPPPPKLPEARPPTRPKVPPGKSPLFAEDDGEQKQDLFAEDALPKSKERLFEERPDPNARTYQLSRDKLKEALESLSQKKGEEIPFPSIPDSPVERPKKQVGAALQTVKDLRAPELPPEFDEHDETEAISEEQKRELLQKAMLRAKAADASKETLLFHPAAHPRKKEPTRPGPGNIPKPSSPPPKKPK